MKSDCLWPGARQGSSGYRSLPRRWPPSTAVDQYQATITEAGRLSVQMDADVGSNLDGFLTLRGPDGELLIESDDSSLGDSGALIDRHLPPGDYHLEVSVSPFAENASFQGGYALRTDWEPATPPFQPVVVEGRPRAITSGDFNGDGHSDLATANAWSMDVAVLLGLGDGTFREHETRYRVGASPGAVSAGDFNGDGWMDVAVANTGSNDVSLLVGNGDGTFRLAERTIAVGKEPTLMSVSDLDGDGSHDLIVSSEGGDIHVLFGSPSLSRRIAWGRGQADVLPAEEVNLPNIHSVFPPQRRQHIDPFQILAEEVGEEPEGDDLYVKGSYRSVAVADFNHDRRLDLIATFKKYDCIVTWLGGEDGKFRRDQIIFAGDDSFGPGEVDDGTQCVVVAAFDGDGHVDLAASNDTSDSVSVRFGRGDGAFAPQGEEYAAGDDAEFILMADFNGDGNSDLVGSAGQVLAVLIGNGDGTFQLPATYGKGTATEAMALGDFNGDGRLDQASLDKKSVPPRLVVMLGSSPDSNDDRTFVKWDGDGTLPKLPLGVSAKSLGAADLDATRPSRRSPYSWPIPGGASLSGRPPRLWWATPRGRWH